MKRVTYQDAGVDVKAKASMLSGIASAVKATFTPRVLNEPGSFAGLFRASFPGIPDPVLVATNDGVGTKTKVARRVGRHRGIGADIVHHCVNDALVQGAEPLFFLDYVAFGTLLPEVVEAVVAGVAAGCRENGCSLVGGETAEMPGLYTPPDYDLAGFIVGWVEEDQVITRDRVRDGDVLVALASSGLHTNGYSLARRIVAERLRLAPGDPFPGDTRSTADVLLAVHRSYLKALAPVRGAIHAMAHITGGGLPGNLDRSLPATLDAEVDTDSWEVPNVFRVLADAGGVARDEMFRAFNMGVGMVVITDEQGAVAVRSSAAAAGVEHWMLGRVVPGSGRVILKGGK